jgi:hypothetical protein
MIDRNVPVKSVAMQTERRRLLPVLAVLLVLVAVGVAAWILARAPGAYIEERAKTSGPPMPWPTMRAFADQEAHRIGNDAILMNLDVYPIGTSGGWQRWQITESLQIHFGYAFPDGSSVDITFEDASPTTTLLVEEKEDNYLYLRQAYHNTQAGRLVSYGELARKVNISPREAIQRTWGQVTQFAREKGVSDPQPVPLSILLLHEQLAWEVTYLINDPTVPTPDWDSRPLKVKGRLVGEFAVDARTGEITSSEYRDNRGIITTELP